MQNPFEDMLEEATPPGQPSLPAPTPTDLWDSEETPTETPTAPGMPIRAPQPLTQSQTPKEFAKEKIDLSFGKWLKNTTTFLGDTGTMWLRLLGDAYNPLTEEDYLPGFGRGPRPAWVEAELRRNAKRIWEQNPHYQEKYPDGFPKEIADHIGENLLSELPQPMRVLLGLAPAWQDMFVHLGATGVELIDRATPGKIPHLMAIQDEVADRITKQYPLWKPEVRQEFTRLWNEGNAGAEYLGEAAMLLGLGGYGIRGAARATRPLGRFPKTPDVVKLEGLPKPTPEVIKNTNKRLGLPENTPYDITRGAMLHKLSKSQFARSMDKVSGHLDAAAKFINEGGEAPGWYSMPVQRLGEGLAQVPGLRGAGSAIAGRINPETGRFQMRSGLADIIDPEAWVFRGIERSIGMAGTAVLSPHAQDFNQTIADLMEAHGIDRNDLLASLASTSEQVAITEAIGLNLDHQHIVNRLNNSLKVFQAETENLLDTFTVDGDLTQLGRSLEQAFENYEREFSRWANHYRNTIVPGSENVVADLTPIFQVRQEMEERRQRLHQDAPAIDEPTMTAYLDDLLNIAQSVGNNQLTPENVQAMQQGQTPPAPRAVQVNTVRTENNLGMPQRIAMSNDYKNEYNVDYQIIPSEKVVTSHDTEGRPSDLFAQIAEHLGYTAEQLQPRDLGEHTDAIHAIAQDLQPAGFLYDMRILEKGAPIVVEVPDFTYTDAQGNTVTETLYLMLAGNNRKLALDIARTEYPEKYQGYRDMMEVHIGDYGYLPEDMSDPTSALFRVLTDKDVRLDRLADQSNTISIGALDAGELGTKDLQNLPAALVQQLKFNFNGSLADILQNEANADVVFQWLQQFSPADSRNMTTEVTARTGKNKGNTIRELSEIGVKRLANALFRRTFNGSYGRKMFQLFVTRQDSDIKNIENAIFSALQDLADLEIGTGTEPRRYNPDYQITEDLAQAVVGAWEMIQEGQQQGLSKTESVQIGRQQGELLTDHARIANEVQNTLLDVIVEGIQHPGVLTAFLQDYVAAVREQGNPDELALMQPVPRDILIDQLHHEYFSEDAETPVVREGEQGYGVTQKQIDAWEADPNIYFRIARRGQRERTGHMGEEDFIDEVRREVIEDIVEEFIFTPDAARATYDIPAHIDPNTVDQNTFRDQDGGIVNDLTDWLQTTDEGEAIIKKALKAELATRDILWDEELQEWRTQGVYGLSSIDSLASYTLPNEAGGEGFFGSDPLRGETIADIIEAADAHDMVIQVVRGTDVTRPQQFGIHSFRQSTHDERIIKDPEWVTEFPADALLDLQYDDTQTWGDRLGLEGYTTIGEPPSPIRLWRAGQRQNAERTAELQAQQRQQVADDIISEVEQLEIDFDEQTMDAEQPGAMQGLKRRLTRGAKKVVRRITDPIRESNRILSIEWEGFIPNANAEAALADLQKIDGIKIDRDNSLHPNIDLIEDEYGNRLPEYENLFDEVDDFDLVEAADYAGYDPDEIQRQLDEGTLDQETRWEIEDIARELSEEALADGTVHSGVEIRLSKLNIRQMEEKLRQLYDVLEKHGAKVNDTAGFHVHIDKRDLSKAQLANILLTWGRYEWAITQQPGWENTYSKALLQGTDPFASQTPDKRDRRLAAFEKSVQNYLRGKGRITSHHGTRLNIEGTGDRQQTIEFRQGQATMDVEQAIKNAAFALNFVENFKNKPARPPVREPADAAIQRLQPKREETDAEYYERLYGDTEIWDYEEGDTPAGKNVKLTDKLAQWDADPELAYVPDVRGIDITAQNAWRSIRPTFRQLMQVMPPTTNQIEVVPGKWTEDGLPGDEVSPNRGLFYPGDRDDRKGTFTLPTEFDTEPLTVFGDAGVPDIFKVRKLFVNILDKVSLPLIGMRIDSPRELAVVAQALRANFESTRYFFYNRKDGEIKGYQVVGLNKANASATLSPDRIKEILRNPDLNADSFFLLHNHPSGNAEFSPEDLQTSQGYKDALPDQFIGQIVINSGEFSKDWRVTPDPSTATSQTLLDEWSNTTNIKFIVHAHETLENKTLDEILDSHLTKKKQFWGRYNYAKTQLNASDIETRLWKSLTLGQDRANLRISVVDVTDPENVKIIKDNITEEGTDAWQIENHVRLTSEEAGYDTTPESISFGAFKIAQGDPRFTGADSPEARAYGEGFDNLQEDVVRFGKQIQTPNNWITIALIGAKKRMMALLEEQASNVTKYSKQDIANSLRKAAAMYGATHAIVYIGEGDWYSSPDKAINVFVDDADPNQTLAPDVVYSVAVANDDNPFVTYEGRAASGFEGQQRPQLIEQLMPEPAWLRERREQQDTGVVMETDETLKGRSQSQREDAGRKQTRRQRAPIDYSTVQRPVTYGKLEAWRTYMRLEKEQHDVGTPKHNAAAKMEHALTEAMKRTMMGYSPETWQDLETFYRKYKDGAISIKSKVAKAIRANAEVKGVEGTSNYARMAQTLFSPGDTPENVNLLYELIGGRDSEAGQRVRQMFLQHLLENARPKGAMTEEMVIEQNTAEQRAALEQAQEVLNTATDETARLQAQADVDAAQAELDRAVQETRTMKPLETINPKGISGEIDKWVKRQGRGYRRATLDAILGKETVDALIDLRNLVERVGTVKAYSSGSRTGPWFARWLKNDAVSTRLTQMLQTLAFAFTPGGGIPTTVGTAIGAYLGRGNPVIMAGAGMVGFLTAWLGNTAMQMVMNHMQENGIGQRYLLEGTVMALDHVLTDTPVFASPKQARQHREQINAADYTGPRHLWHFLRLQRYLPRQQEDEERIN